MNNKKLTSVLIISVMIFAGAISITEYYRDNGSSPNNAGVTGVFGPSVNISCPNTLEGDGFHLSNNTTINIQLYLPVPQAVHKGLNTVDMLGMNRYNNSVEDLLMNITIYPLNDTYTKFFLPITFDRVSHEWSNITKHYTGNTDLSMTVEAIKTVTHDNGTLYIYQYYNNVPFNPLNVHIGKLSAVTEVSDSSTGASINVLNRWFNGSDVNVTQYSQVVYTPINFNVGLSFSDKPLEIVHEKHSVPNISVSNNNMKNEQMNALITPVKCGNPIVKYECKYYNVTSSIIENVTDFHGMLPLSIAHIGRNADNGKSLVDTGNTISLSDSIINLSSNQVYESSSGQITTTVSPNPSVSKVFSFIGGGSATGANAYPTAMWNSLVKNSTEGKALNHTTVVIGIPGVSYYFERYSTYTYLHKEKLKILECPNTGSYSINVLSNSILKTTFDGRYTVGQITNINTTNGLQLSYSNLPISAVWVIQHYLKTKTGSFNLNDSGRGDTYSTATFYEHSAGWLNVSSAYKQVSDGLKIFSAALGLELAIVSAESAANGADMDATEPAVILAVTSIIAHVIGLSGDILGDMSSVGSFSNTGNAQIFSFISNSPAPGSNYTVNYFESNNPIELNLNGQTYFFHAPDNFYNATEITTA